MKTIPRRVLLAAVALAAALLFSGCTTARVAKSGRPGHFFEMTVVQRSGPLELTPKEMTQLREAVINFVQKEGVLRNGAYYVEVKFNQAAGETAGSWVVVKLVEREAADYEMVASSSSQWPYYYYSDPFYSRYGYASFGNYPFDSFDYAYGGGGGYYPPQPRLHPGEHHRPNDNDDHHDGRPNDNDHNANDHHHDDRTSVARHDGRGDFHPPASGGDHHSPEPHRRWESGDSARSYTSSSSGSNSSSSDSSSSGSGSSSSSSASVSTSDSSSRGGDVREYAPQNQK